MLWNVEYHIPLVNFSLPRRLPDLDGDGVGELVAAVAVTLPSEVTDGRHHPRFGHKNETVSLRLETWRLQAVKHSG